MRLGGIYNMYNTQWDLRLLYIYLRLFGERDLEWLRLLGCMTTTALAHLRELVWRLTIYVYRWRRNTSITRLMMGLVSTLTD